MNLTPEHLINLKASVADQPELVAAVAELDNQRHRFAKLLYDLGRLDEALVQRVFMLQMLVEQPYVGEVAYNCQQLLVTISAFINMALSEPEARAKNAETVYNELMKKMK